jgi:hypothetical protein
MPINVDKVVALTLHLEELTKDVTWRGGKPEDLPDVLPVLEEIWWEVKHCRFCLSELGGIRKDFDQLKGNWGRESRYKAAKDAREGLRAIRDRIQGKSGNGDGVAYNILITVPSLDG